MDKRPETNLDDLSYELLHSIFEHLHPLNPASLAKLRLLSRHFNDIIATITFRAVDLHPTRLSSMYDVNSSFQKGLMQNFCAHTQHLSIHTALDWARVVDLLLNMKRFKSLWYFSFLC